MNEDQKREEVLSILNQAMKEGRFEQQHCLTDAQIKHRTNLSSQEIIAALSYLSDQKYVKKETKNKIARYKISAPGTDYLSNEKSKFNKAANSVFVQYNSGIISQGDNNIISQKFHDTYDALEEFKTFVSNSSLPEQEKTDISADISTIEVQVIKTEPIKSVVEAVWKNLEKLATISELSAAYLKLEPYIEALLHKL